MFWCELIFNNLSHPFITKGHWNKPIYISLSLRMFIQMYIKLDRFYFSVFDLVLKGKEILKYRIYFNISFPDVKQGWGWGTNYQVLGKY